MKLDLEILGTGGEGAVYKDGDLAIKIFKNPDCEELSKALLNVDLKRIVTPQDLLYEDGKFIGYTMKLVNSNRDIRTLKKEELLTNIELLKDDMKTLSYIGIEGRDFIPKNSLLSNDELYFIDTSLYKVSTMNQETIEKYNIAMLYYYLKCLLGYSSGSLESRKKIQTILLHMKDYFKEMSYDETIEEYAKRLVRTY